MTGSGDFARGRGDGDAGDNVTIDVELITPIAMDKGLRFAIREGGRTVGAGTVTEIIESAESTRSVQRRRQASRWSDQSNA